MSTWGRRLVDIIVGGILLNISNRAFKIRAIESSVNIALDIGE